MTKADDRKHVQSQLAAHGIKIRRAASGAWILMKADRRMAVFDIADLQDEDIERFAGDRPNHSRYTPGDCLW